MLLIPYSGEAYHRGYVYVRNLGLSTAFRTCPSVVISVVVIIVPIFLHHLGIIFLRKTVFGL